MKTVTVAAEMVMVLERIARALEENNARMERMDDPEWVEEFMIQQEMLHEKVAYRLGRPSMMGKEQ